MGLNPDIFWYIWTLILDGVRYLDIQEASGKSPTESKNTCQVCMFRFDWVMAPRRRTIFNANIKPRPKSGPNYIKKYLCYRTFRLRAASLYKWSWTCKYPSPSECVGATVVWFDVVSCLVSCQCSGNQKKLPFLAKSWNAFNNAQPSLSDYSWSIKGIQVSFSAYYVLFVLEYPSKAAPLLS